MATQPNPPPPDSVPPQDVPEHPDSPPAFEEPVEEMPERPDISEPSPDMPAIAPPPD
jgi:hypothetical protein